MNFYMDTEFLEGKQNKYFCGIKLRHFNLLLASLVLFTVLAVIFTTNVSELNTVILISLALAFYIYLGLIKNHITENTIQLISIGMVTDYNKSFYQVSKDFNLKEAWNRYDTLVTGERVYWIRNNVLYPIFQDFLKREESTDLASFGYHNEFTYRNFKYFLNKYGYTEKQLKNNMLNFVYNEAADLGANKLKSNKPKFYGYFCDYDWVVFCWLFGRMIDLPSNFPMYCVDVEQILNEKLERKSGSRNNIEMFKENMKLFPEYPKLPEGFIEHHALSDAFFVRGLFHFIKNHI